MAPIVKDVENSTLTSTPVVPANPAVKAPQDPATRPQPIPLEVAVSVNGARTVEGTDKREPFSESTKTVLVFANGAVIRLASSVAPGQLLFVTNEKSKKEVVCQVVKSKNYRTVTGYVELEFTEPAAGFWGIRIPTEQAAPSAPAPKAPLASRPVAPPVAVSPAAGSPKVATPAPPAVAPTAAVIPPRPGLVKPSVPSSVISPVEHKISPAAAPVSHIPGQPVAPPPPAPAKSGALPVQLAAQISALVSPKPADASPEGKPEGVKPTTGNTAAEASTEELRQQAARLQEQLSSLLFRESAAKPATPSVAAPPAESTRGVAPAKDAAHPVVEKTEVTVKPVPISSTEKAPTIPAPAVEFKSTPIISKPSSISLPVEEVKIPTWLAPLARETETPKETSSVSELSSPSISEISAYSAAEEKSTSVAEETAQQSHTVVFGGQLLAGSAGTESQVSSSGSKAGLFIGLAAVALLTVGGGVWYGMQPGNFLASKAATTQPLQNNIPSSNISAERTAAAPLAGTPVSNTPVSTSPASATRPAASSQAAVPAADANRVSNSASAPATTAASTPGRNSASVEQPKKPVLGEVHLATPNVNRTADSSASEAAPLIDDASPTNTGDPLVGLAVNHSKEPAAPLAIGGDVKPAHLVKSIPPAYPPAARTQRIAGDVKMDALIDATGNVTATKIISGPTMLHQAAMAAVKQWKYEPAFLDGKPTSMHLTVTVQFRLQ